MASLGHSGSQAPQLMQSEVMCVDMLQYGRNVGSYRGDVKRMASERRLASLGERATVRARYALIGTRPARLGGNAWAGFRGGGSGRLHAACRRPLQPELGLLAPGDAAVRHVAAQRLLHPLQLYGEQLPEQRSLRGPQRERAGVPV